MKTIYLIGCGGVGSWLAPALVRFREPKSVVLVDGDRLEKKNLDRQLFGPEAIGQNKAFALSDLYGCQHEPAWFTTGLFELDASDWLLVAADNHPARIAALQECDRNGCRAIIAANETWSAEASVYLSEWRGQPMDYRVFCSESLTDRGGDPRGAAIGCTGEAQQQNRQLINANLMASSLAMHLLALWHKPDRNLAKYLPYRIVQNMTKTETYKPRDHQTERTTP